MRKNTGLRISSASFLLVFAFILKWSPRLSSEQWKQLEDDAAVTAGRRALELSPKHIPSIELCARIILDMLSGIWHDTYSGFPEVQFPHKELEEARHYITQLPDSPVKIELSAELSSLQQSFENWPEK